MAVSNNVLAGLLLVAIVVSIVGISQLGLVTQKPGVRFTGAETGVTNLTVSQTIAIEMVRNITDFGSGQPSGGSILNIASDTDNGGSFDDGSEGNGSADSYGGCVGSYDEDNCAFPFVIRNIGNKENTNLNISASKNAASFITCTGASCAQTPTFEAKAKNNETGSCNTGLLTTWTTLATSEIEACTSLNSSNSKNELRVHFKIGIPSNAEQVTQQNTITIEAT